MMKRKRVKRRAQDELDVVEKAASLSAARRTWPPSAVRALHRQALTHPPTFHSSLTFHFSSCTRFVSIAKGCILTLK